MSTETNQEVEVKRKRGRPREFFYTEEMAGNLKKAMAGGGDVAELCLILGLKSKDSFYKHLEKNEQLKDDYSEGKLLREVWYRSRIRDMIENPDKEKNKNLKVKLFMWQAANQHPDVFSHDVNPGAPAPSTINIGTITHIESKQPTQLDYEEILEKLAKFAQNPQLTQERATDGEIIETDGSTD